MKGFAATRKSNTTLLKDIQAYMVEQAIKRGQSDREPHKIHVSEVVKENWCPRQAYYKVHKVPSSDLDNSINHRSETFFDTGHEAHQKWQNWLQGMGVLWGTYRCLTCE